MNNEPMTVEQFNRMLGMGSCNITPNQFVKKVEGGLNRICPIHLKPMEDIQHPMKPLGVIVAQICRLCQDEYEKTK